MDRKLSRLRMCGLVCMLAILAVHAILRVDFYTLPLNQIERTIFWIQVYALPPFLYVPRMGLLIVVFVSINWFLDFLGREVMPFVQRRRRKFSPFWPYLLFLCVGETEGLKNELIRAYEDSKDRMLMDLCRQYAVESHRVEMILYRWRRIELENERDDFLMGFELKLARDKRNEKRPPPPQSPLRAAEVVTARQMKIRSFERETKNCTAPRAISIRQRALTETNEKERLRLLHEVLVAQSDWEKDLPSFVKHNPARANKK